MSGNWRPDARPLEDEKPREAQFQYQVEPRSSEPAPGGEGFEVREADVNFNHSNK